MKRKSLKVSILLLSSLWLLISFGTVPTFAANEWFDSYGKIPWEDERAHLHNFARFLQHDPEMMGYIGYNWRNNAEFKEMKRRAIRAQRFLVKELKIDKSRIIIIKGGPRDEPRTVLQPSKKGLPPLDFS